MTTKIHIVNFGPDKVEASIVSDATGISSPTVIWPSQYNDFYVYDNHDILVKEIPNSKPV